MSLVYYFFGTQFRIIMCVKFELSTIHPFQRWRRNVPNFKVDLVTLLNAQCSLNVSYLPNCQISFFQNGCVSNKWCLWCPIFTTLMENLALPMRSTTWFVRRGSITIHIWNPGPRFTSPLYNWASPLLSGFRSKNVPSKRVPKLAVENFVFTTTWHHNRQEIAE